MTRTHHWGGRCVAIVGFVVLAVAGGAEYVGAIGGNVRVVEPGLVYRGAQLTGDHLQNLLRSQGIRSVMNLRGQAVGDAALSEERALCESLDIAHVDIDLSARRLPPPDQLLLLLNAFDRLPRPLFVHCRGGADRSGLVSALYLVVYRDVPLDEALESQLTWRYGHLRRRAPAMDDFFDMYRSSSGTMPLREWITDVYPKLYKQAQAPVQSDPTRLRRE